MRALKVWTGVCMVCDKYWYVSRFRLGIFRVENFSWKMFGYGCLLPRDSVGLYFFSHLQNWWELRKCIQVHAWSMIGTGMSLGIGYGDLGWKLFYDRCLWMGAYSLGSCIHTHNTHMHAYTHAGIHTCTHTHTCMHAHIHTTTHILCMHTHTCIHTHTHTHTYTLSPTYSHAYTDMHACIHAYAHACTHTQWHAHTHIHSLTVYQK